MTHYHISAVKIWSLWWSHWYNQQLLFNSLKNNQIKGNERVTYDSAQTKRGRQILVLPKYEKLLGIKIDCKLSFDDHMRNFSQCFIYLFFVLYVWCTLNCQLKNKEIIMKNKNSYELCSAIAFLNKKNHSTVWMMFYCDDLIIWTRKQKNGNANVKYSFNLKSKKRTLLDPWYCEQLVRQLRTSATTRHKFSNGSLY